MGASRLVGLLAALAVIAPGLARAHPMGNFSISHYAAIQVEPEGVRLRYLLDLAEIPTFQILQAERLPAEPDHPAVRAYLARTAEALADGLVLALDGQRLALRSEAAGLIFPPGAGGLPTLKIMVVYRAALPHGEAAAPATLTYRDHNYPARAGWKEVIATGAPGATLVASSVPERDRSRELGDYPIDPAESPPPQTLEAHLLVSRPGSSIAVARATPLSGAPGEGPSAASPAQPIGAVDRAHEPADLTAPVGTASATASLQEGVTLRANVRTGPRDVLTALIAWRPVGPGMVLFTMAVAASLGAFHALEPGHGKTVVAAYLVGARGTAGHALLLGLVVTASHTVGVYLLGGLTLYASRHVVPEHLYPWLGAVSGLLIVLLGASLLWRRLVGSSATGPGHTHDDVPGHDAATHAAAHTHGRAHQHDSDHGHHHHASDGPVSLRALVALGVSGGIVPCPAALVVLLSAVAMGRVGYGLLLIVAFSAGLAAVLIAIGLLVVGARRLAWRLGARSVDGPLVRRWLPLTSAAVITLSGVVITVKALGG